MRRTCGTRVNIYYKSDKKHRCIAFRREIACNPKRSNKYIIISDDFTFLQKPHIIFYK